MDRPRPDLRRISRRTAFGLLGAGAASVALAAYLGPQDGQARPPDRTGGNPLVAESKLPGERFKRKGAGRASRADDIARQIQGYASANSVGNGETIGFHVAVADGGAYDIGVYRLGHYGGAGSRLVTTSPSLEGEARDIPVPDPRTLLSASPYPDKLGRSELVQNTGLVVGEDGTMVFVAGTFHWSRALGETGDVAKAVKIATKNLLNRMITEPEE